MGSFSGAIQRPLVAATAVALASFSADISDKLPFRGSSRDCDCSTSNLVNSSPSNIIQGSDSPWVSHISDSKLADLSFVTRIPVPVPNVQFRVPSDSNCSLTKSRTVVVLLGWLGARQKHLKKYAEWYTSRGFHVITFTFPMGEVLSYKPGGKAEQNVHLLVDHLADWLDGESEKNLVFHTFSNTGWLTYGVILEHFQKQDPSVMERIRGCIVDSAPVAYPDAKIVKLDECCCLLCMYISYAVFFSYLVFMLLLLAVLYNFFAIIYIITVWASGFSAAFLKKNSVATKGRVFSNESGIKVSIGSEDDLGLKPAATEAALLLILKKFFEVILYLPSVNRRLSDVMSRLSTKQPSCPQLYMYSTADRVIPADSVADSVESFVEAQRRAGHDVRACNFVSSPHVDHFRNDPKLYTSQLNQFLEECVLDRCKSF
uniref:Transmembrane protein 53 n=1 Tax=Cajanus cajan TaxID=3821 RepID=A0A151TQJ1_CAJCA|nr:Transmembrane protein 53 [Cajanus cajan]